MTDQHDAKASAGRGRAGPARVTGSRAGDRGRTSDRASLKSLAKVVDVLDGFSRRRTLLTPADVAERTGLPRATAHRLLKSMREVGLLQQNGPRGGYKLGIKLFQLGGLVMADLDLTQRASRHVTRLQYLTGEGIHLCQFDGSQMAFVDRQEMDAGGPISSVTRISSAATYCTGVGKAFLAWQPERLVRRIIEDGLVAQTPNTITDPAALLAELARIRARGYAIDDEENELNVRCVAAPIRDLSGAVFAAISVSGPVARMPDVRLKALAPTVTATARDIERDLGVPESPART